MKFIDNTLLCIPEIYTLKCYITKHIPTGLEKYNMARAHTTTVLPQWISVYGILTYRYKSNHTHLNSICALCIKLFFL